MSSLEKDSVKLPHCLVSNTSAFARKGKFEMEKKEMKAELQSESGIYTPIKLSRKKLNLNPISLTVAPFLAVTCIEAIESKTSHYDFV